MNKDTRDTAELLRKCGFLVTLLHNHQKPTRLNQDGSVHSFPQEREVIGAETDSAENALSEFVLMFDWFHDAAITLRVVSVYTKNGKYWASGMCSLYEQPRWEGDNRNRSS